MLKSKFRRRPRACTLDLRVAGVCVLTALSVNEYASSSLKSRCNIRADGVCMLPLIEKQPG